MNGLFCKGAEIILPICYVSVYVKMAVMKFFHVILACLVFYLCQKNSIFAMVRCLKKGVHPAAI